jgi:hypothetical protein
MKKLHIALLLFAFVGLTSAALAQEPQEFKMSIGDTLVWKPFDKCSMTSYNVKGPKNISYRPIKTGDRLQIIALKAGKSSIIATCNDNESQITANLIISDLNEVTVTTEKPVKPATQPFTGTFSFNPPADHFFITINDQGTNFNETYMKLGDNEAFNDGQGIDRFWNVKTGKNWYYRPDAQGWTDDVDWEFEAFGESFAPLNSFANEVEKNNLSNYYVGTEKVLDIDCWHFFVDYPDGTVIQYWVDPANGCTLKRKVNADPAKVVTVYDLQYTKLYFGPSFKKSLHDTTR